MLSHARALWRAAREAPIIGRLFAAVDRIWWARTIRRAHIVDQDVVAAQLGRAVSARYAIRRYVRGGFRTGFTLNALAMERTISRQLSDADRVPAIYAYLVNDQARLQVSPCWDAVRLAASEPAALSDPAGPLGFAWRRARREGWLELGDAAAVRRVAWTDALRAVLTPIVVAAAPVDATDGLFVCVLGPQEADADGVLDLARQAAVGLDLDVDLVVMGSSFEESAQAALLRLLSPRIAVRRAPPSETGALPSHSRSGLTVYRGPDAALTPAGMRELAGAGANEPVAALWLAPDGTIASAGTVFHQGAAVELLAGHPSEDARRLGAGIPVPSLAGPARAWPAGANPRGPGSTLTSTTVFAPPTSDPDQAGLPPDHDDTDIDKLLALAGLAVSRWNEQSPVLMPVGGSAVGEFRPLRWAIKIAAPVGPAGESWGDTHFARALARALEAQGQLVAVDGYQARNRPSSYLDDVTVVLRGPRRVVPPGTGCTMLWIISHPDEITADELDDFDAVFAASTHWAEAATARFGRKVEPLLQCTDTSRFHPSGAHRTDEIVFVGTARGIARPVVVEPLRAGVPVRVYGPDWTGYIPGSAIAATAVDNARLPELYERAGVVLNDHWPAMRREGFVSNRLYDVVAAGGRAISDDVDGIEGLFEGAVRVYRTHSELVDMLKGDIDALFPSDDRLAAASERVRARDSFDQRASTLLSAAMRRRIQPR